MTQRQIMTNHFVCLENFCENLCLHNGILSLQQITKKQIRLNLCDLLWQQNSVAATKIFTKILQYTRSDLLLRCVASPCCCNLSPSVYRPLNKSQCMAFFTGKNNGFPFLDIFGYLKNTHKNPKFGKVRQVPTKFPDWDLSHSSKFGIFVGIL